MFSSLLRNSSPLFLNKNISEFCRNSTNESIRKLTEKNNIEKNKPKINFNFDDNNNDDNNKKDNFNFYEFIFFLTFSSIAFLLYKRIK